MSIEIDFQSGVPIYVQICEQVKIRIASGSLMPGAQLPTSRELAKELGINFNTVARAYRKLDQAGLVSTQHGRGAFVLPYASQAMEGELRKEALKSLIEQFLEQAARLAHSSEEVAHMVKQGLQSWEAASSPSPSEGDSR